MVLKNEHLKIRFIIFSNGERGGIKFDLRSNSDNSYGVFLGVTFEKFFALKNILKIFEILRLWVAKIF